MIRVLIVDDSLTAREYLKFLIDNDAELQTVGTAQNGQEALQKVEQLQPDLVTMDITMPGLNGYETTRRIMERHPVPIVIVSAHLDAKTTTHSFEALQAGAVATIAKPRGLKQHPQDPSISQLMKTIKSMAKVKVIKRFPRKEKNVSHVEAKAFMNASDGPHGIEVIVIGGSTGAPPVLKTIFSCLCPHFSIPVFVVQHISPGFLVGMLEWLSKDLPFSFKIAENDQQIMPGTITFAPEDAHLSLRADNRLHVSQEPLENGLRPSVAPLFRSAAVHFGKRALGILLTGMGKDGAKELKLLHNHGGITIAQDKASSIVHGMPGEAIALKGADLIYSPPEISRYLNSLIKDTKTACFQSNHSH